MIALEIADLAGKGVVEKEDGSVRLRKFLEILEQIVQEEGQMSLKTLAVKGEDLIAAGFVPGKALGKALNELLNLVLAEQLPNEKQALLDQAKQWL